MLSYKLFLEDQVNQLLTEWFNPIDPEVYGSNFPYFNNKQFTKNDTTYFLHRNELVKVHFVKKSGTINLSFAISNDFKNAKNPSEINYIGNSISYLDSNMKSLAKFNRVVALAIKFADMNNYDHISFFGNDEQLVNLYDTILNNAKVIDKLETIGWKYNGIESGKEWTHIISRNN